MIGSKNPGQVNAMQASWKKAGIEPASTKAWKPKADLLAFLRSL